MAKKSIGLFSVAAIRDALVAKSSLPMVRKFRKEFGIEGDGTLEALVELVQTREDPAWEGLRKELESYRKEAVRLVSDGLVQVPDPLDPFSVRTPFAEQVCSAENVPTTARIRALRNNGKALLKSSAKNPGQVIKGIYHALSLSKPSESDGENIVSGL